MFSFFSCILKDGNFDVFLIKNTIQKVIQVMSTYFLFILFILFLYWKGYCNFTVRYALFTWNQNNTMTPFCIFRSRKSKNFSSAVAIESKNILALLSEIYNHTRQTLLVYPATHHANFVGPSSPVNTNWICLIFSLLWLILSIWHEYFGSRFL